jgi:hypothetical protein
MAVTTILVSRDVVTPAHETEAHNPNPYFPRGAIIPSQLLNVASNAGTGGTGGGPGGLGDTAGGAAWMHRVG